MEFIAIVIFGIILIVVTSYIILYVIYPGSGNNDVLKTMLPLNEKKTVVTADDVQTKLLGSGGSTVMAFFKLDSGDRTSKFADQFTPLLYVDNNWYLEIAPAPVGKEKSAARLRVQTNHGGTVKSEFIELPPIPKQKWICIAILREGRRFDVIYDNKIVASQRLENYPVVVSSPLSVGNKGLDGNVIHIIINNERLGALDVERERVTHVDTNNVVLEGNPINVSFPVINLFAKCPSGLPCDTVTTPPANNLVAWKSPYA